MEKKKTVDVVVDLGDLKPLVLKTAKRWGVSVDEFITDALAFHVRQHEEDREERFVRHGGKHRMGKQTGYEVTADGKYYPAPQWVQHFEQLFAERAAIYNLVNSLVAQAQERLVAVEKNITEAKGRLIDDLRLDPSKPWTYYGGEAGYLQEEKADKKPKK